MLLWTSLYTFLFEHLFSFLLGLYPGLELLSPTVTLRGTCEAFAGSSPQCCTMSLPEATHGGSDFSLSGFSLNQLLTSRPACVGSSAGLVSHLKRLCALPLLTHTTSPPPGSPAFLGCGMAPFGRTTERGTVAVESLFGPAWHYRASLASSQDGQVPGPPGAANTRMAGALWRRSLRTHVVPIRHALRSVRLSTTYYY